MPSSFAVTRPVNPPGVEPIISEEQLWKGLEYKARNPAGRFCPGYHVVQGRRRFVVDNGDKLVREVTFAGSSEIRTENVEAHAAAIVYFEMNTGLRVTNTISYGPNDEIFLTYGFANGIPGVPADQPKPSAKELNARIGKSVEGSIAVVRQMVKDGKL
ncbi:DUF1857-domain-containing protein [Mycena polygramma]|nr:DUF1857-domain-containing protein [Mycena polygramma]